MLENKENPTHLEGGARGVLDHWFEVSRIDPYQRGGEEDQSR